MTPQPEYLPLVELHPHWVRAAKPGMDTADSGFTVAALTDGAFTVTLNVIPPENRWRWRSASVGFARTCLAACAVPARFPPASASPVSGSNHQPGAGMKVHDAAHWEKSVVFASKQDRFQPRAC